MKICFRMILWKGELKVPEVSVFKHPNAYARLFQGCIFCCHSCVKCRLAFPLVAEVALCDQSALPNWLSRDYQRLEEHDKYDPVDVDDEFVDTRDAVQMFADRRAAEAELDERDATRGLSRKFPTMLDESGMPLSFLELEQN